MMQSPLLGMKLDMNLSDVVYTLFSQYYRLDRVECDYDDNGEKSYRVILEGGYTLKVYVGTRPRRLKGEEYYILKVEEYK